MLPDAAKPRSTGSSMFRFVIPREVVNQVTPDAPLGRSGSRSGSELNVRLALDGTKRSVVSYPCRNHELLNVGCIASNALINLPTADSWVAPGTKEDLLRVFGDFYVRPILE